jgi:hypothetical protein
MHEIAVINEAFPTRGFKVITKPTSERISVVSHSTRHSPPRGTRIDGKATGTTLVLDRLENIEASEPAIRQQLSRMLQRSVFVRSERLSRFLRFVVEHVIDGRQRQNFLKEYVNRSRSLRPPAAVQSKPRLDCADRSSPPKRQTEGVLRDSRHK